MRRMLARLGAPVCRALIQLRCADAIGTGTADAAEQTARCEAALSLLAQAEKGCSSVSTLAVSGRDLLALGMTQGPAVRGRAEAPAGRRSGRLRAERPCIPAEACFRDWE